MKYVSKGPGGVPFPSGLRICGSGGLDRLAADEFHYWRLPRYVREHIEIGERCSRRVGGGWVSRLTGEYWCSDVGLFGVARVVRDGLADTVVMLHSRWKRVRMLTPLIQAETVAAWVRTIGRDCLAMRAAWAAERAVMYETRAVFLASGARATFYRT